jgi:hypothetical protein
VQRDKTPLTAAQQAGIDKARAAQTNTAPCAKGCGFVAKTAAGKSAHERQCGGTS